jgi:hypothetical protein
MAEVHQAAAVTHVINTGSGRGRTALQIAAGVGCSGPLASLAAEAAVRAGTLERVEGGGVAGIRYAQPGKGV